VVPVVPREPEAVPLVFAEPVVPLAAPELMVPFIPGEALVPTVVVEPQPQAVSAMRTATDLTPLSRIPESPAPLFELIKIGDLS
jgi:hypothetical protein